MNKNALARLTLIQVGAVALLLSHVGPATAIFINNSSGLTSPGQVITFDAPAVSFHQIVTNQYPGVTFSGAYYDGDVPAAGDPIGTFVHVSGHRISNFIAGQAPAAFSMRFDTPQNRVAFSMATWPVTSANQPSTSTFTALLNGVLVETGSAATTLSNPNDFFGFEGILFDEIRISVNSLDSGLLFDNLQTGSSAPSHFINNDFGLTNPCQVIIFDEHVLSTNQSVTTQYSDLGVTFTGAFYDPDISDRGHVVGHRIGNFVPFVPYSAFSMHFNTPQNHVAFAIFSQPGTATFTALLNGVVVETASAATSLANPTDFFGFEGITFDEIQIAVSSIDHALVLDNIQTGACPVVSVTGAVSLQCTGCQVPSGASEGIFVNLVDGSGDTHTTSTSSGGIYAFQGIAASANPGTVTISPPLGFQVTSPTGGQASVSLQADVTADFQLQCLSVEVSGTVTTACSGPIANVQVDLLDACGGFHPTVTDANGQYRFTGVPYSATPAGAEISISIPLGYEPVTPALGAAAITLDADRVVDFALDCLEPIGPPRAMGYWKHQANVYLNGRGSAEESETDMRTTYPAAIFQHFYENNLNGIQVLDVTYRNLGSYPAAIELATIANTLTVNRGGTTIDRAKQQYLTMLLNVSSGKLLTSTVVSVDGATCSQALQQVATYINDGDAANDVIAKDIAETINNAQFVSAGVIDLGTEHIPYKSTHAPLTELLSVGPSPAHGSMTVRFSLAEARPVAVKVFSTAGRLVHEFTRRTLGPGQHILRWDGRDRTGREAPAGVYFVQVNLGRQEDVRRLVLLR